MTFSNGICLMALFAFLGSLWFYGMWRRSKKMLTDEFKSLSFDVMEKSFASFMRLAETTFGGYQKRASMEWEEKEKGLHMLLNPLKESLDKIQKSHLEIEKSREGAYVSLQKQIDSLMDSELRLRTEAANLASALKSPNIRGAWGQIHLRRVVELSGMMNHCDFYEQVTQKDDEGTFRPDLVIQLPGERKIIVDAKTPLDAYLQAMELKEEKEQKKKLLEHAAHIRNHMKDLGNKEYWKHLSSSIEYVILFLPAEGFFSAALEADPSLLEAGLKHHVMVATPTTLIAILRAVAFGWKQDKISKRAEEIAKLGSSLYERLEVMSSYLSKVGKSLSASVECYNQCISSMESRVLVSARKLKQMGADSGDKSIEILEEITKSTRSCPVTEQEEISSNDLMKSND